jgi:hypothetical protein
MCKITVRSNVTLIFERAFFKVHRLHLRLDDDDEENNNNKMMMMMIAETRHDHYLFVSNVTLIKMTS